MQKWILFLSLCLSLNVFADHPDFDLGDPEVMGDGCDKNSVGVTLSPDKSALSVLFDKFIAEAKGDKKFERRNCRIIVPLDLHTDETVSIFEMEYRGYNFLPSNAISNLIIDSWFGEKQGPSTKNHFKGELDGEYRVVDKVAPHNKHWAPCGRPIRLHIQTGIRVKTNAKGEQAMITVDTLDVTRGITYKFEKLKCKREHNDRWDNHHRRHDEDKKERSREDERMESFKRWFRHWNR